MDAVAESECAACMRGIATESSAWTSQHIRQSFHFFPFSFHFHSIFIRSIHVPLITFIFSFPRCTGATAYEHFTNHSAALTLTAGTAIIIIIVFVLFSYFQFVLLCGIYTVQCTAPDTALSITFVY
jgi:hypothetical protein